jgi:hypothetical protein
MPQAGFEPVIPACERQQTHALDRAATAIGLLQIYSDIYVWRRFTNTVPSERDYCMWHRLVSLTWNKDNFPLVSQHNSCLLVNKFLLFKINTVLSFRNHVRCPQNTVYKDPLYNKTLYTRTHYTTKHVYKDPLYNKTLYTRTHYTTKHCTQGPIIQQTSTFELFDLFIMYMGCWFGFVQCYFNVIPWWWSYRGSKHVAVLNVIH